MFLINIKESHSKLVITLVLDLWYAGLAWGWPCGLKQFPQWFEVTTQIIEVISYRNLQSIV